VPTPNSVLRRSGDPEIDPRESPGACYLRGRIHWGVDVSQAMDTDSFALTTSPAAYLPRPDTQRALVALEEWVLSGAAGSIWLTGPPGLGKTLLLKVLADRLSGHRLCVYVAYPVLPPEEFAAWVLDAVGEHAGDAPQDRIAAFADQRAVQGGLLLLIDDAMLLPPATRSALDLWYGESNGALRSVLAATGSPSGMGAGGYSGDPCVNLDEPLSFEESRTLLTAAMERNRFSGEARALFDDATLEAIHEHAHGVPTRLLIEAGRVLFIRREEVAPRNSAPLPKWSASTDAAPDQPPATPAQPAAETIPEPLAPTPAAPMTAATAAGDEPALGAEPSALADLVCECGRPPDGTRDRERPPAARPRRRRVLTDSARYAGAFGAGAFATLIAIQLLGNDPETTVAPPAAALPMTAPAALPAVGAAPATAATQPTSPAAMAHVEATSGNQIVTEGVIRKGEWLAASFRSHDIPMSILTLIGREVGDVFDFTRSRPGHRYTVTRDAAGELLAFRYVIGPGDELLVRRSAEEYAVTRSAPGAR